MSLETDTDIPRGKSLKAAVRAGPAQKKEDERKKRARALAKKRRDQEKALQRQRFIEREPRDDDVITISEACIEASGYERPISRATYYRLARKGLMPAPMHPTKS